MILSRIVVVYFAKADVTTVLTLVKTVKALSLLRFLVSVE